MSRRFLAVLLTLALVPAVHADEKDKDKQKPEEKKQEEKKQQKEDKETHERRHVHVDVEIPDVDLGDLDMDLDHAKHHSSLCGNGYADGTAVASGGEGKAATVAVKTPVHFMIELQSADLQISGGGDKISVSAEDCGKDEIKIYSNGKDTYEAAFDEEGSCEGPVKVQLPAGSAVDIEEMEGDIVATGVLGNVRIESVSGGITLDTANDIDVEAVQGDLVIKNATGRVRIETVNGDTRIAMAGNAPEMTYQSTSGGLKWAGACGKGCRLRVEVYSGDVGLALDPTASSFALAFASQSGDLNDGLGMTAGEKRKNIAGIMKAKAQYGKAEGSIAVKMYSGDLTVSKR